MSRHLILILACLPAVIMADEPQPVFSRDGLPELAAIRSEPASAVAIDRNSDGEASLKWTFSADGETPYGNGIFLKTELADWSDKDDLVLEVFVDKSVTGRIGCQLAVQGLETALADINPHLVKGRWEGVALGKDKTTTLEGGKWQEVRIPIRERDLREVSELRLFCDGRQFPKGDHVFYLRNIRLENRSPNTRSGQDRRMPAGVPLENFSVLPKETQESLRRMVAAPPLAERSNPYSTFMCYPMWRVIGTDGKPMLGSSPDGKFHPEWQEALVKSWADLGITKLHFYAWPDGCGSARRSFEINQETREGIRAFAELCKKYGVKIGLRVDPPYELEKPENLPPNQDPTGDYWPSHPRNPDNELAEFFDWLVQVLKLMDGRVEYVVLGDEIDSSRKVRPDRRHWTLADFMTYTRRGADAVHKVYPKIKVSLPSFGAGSWPEIVEMLEMGYGEFADAVAINNDNYRLGQTFQEDLDRLCPQKKLVLLSNGVGYISSDTRDRNPPQDVYRKYSDDDQAAMIARSMYYWWEIDGYVAPYYVAVRNFIYQGKKRPMWYGFFGFMDLDIAANDEARTIHYPAWNAYQTIAQTFHDRAQFADVGLAVESTSENTLHLKAFARGDRELVLILWGEKVPGQTTDVFIPTLKFTYPVQVDIGDFQKWSDLPGEVSSQGILMRDVPLGMSPTIIRLFSLDNGPKPISN